ncbi:Pentapeptide repeat-containing protein [Streptomyces sp. 3213]|uniref:pentapeptide repeat-containing protein n=1 Tax=Streptomyces sp. 3213.3 TaxID=1855348 RepID=UPI0008997217|nr:pentapeptide repeat-containing protein [Streptomyces sp. 3213.3]SEC15498.1 Pentapeptide repeat-containing protein [Streptomyces sp. 3213] [Streptomyces sp. 3213.3]
MRRTAWLAVTITVGIGVLLVWCVAFAPAWIVRHDIGVHGGFQLAAADRLNAVNDVRVVLLQGAAGLVALSGIGLGAVMTLRQIRVNREGQYIDLFARAIEQLSSEQVSVRHGGVYAMEQIAEAAPHYRGHVAALLASFVRQQAPWPPTRPLDEVDAERSRYTGGLRDDVGGAIAALSRRSMVLPGYSIELEKVDLRGAEMVDHNLSGFCFAGSNLDGANLAGCDLSHTTFADASLRNANLTGATLTDANLNGTDLTGATGIGTPPAPRHAPAT